MFVKNLCSSPKKDWIWESASTLLRFSSRRRFGHPEAFVSFSRTKHLNCLEWFELESKELFNYIKALYINKWIMFDTVYLFDVFCVNTFGHQLMWLSHWCGHLKRRLPFQTILHCGRRRGSHGLNMGKLKVSSWKWWNGGSDKPWLCLSGYVYNIYI